MTKASLKAAPEEAVSNLVAKTYQMQTREGLARKQQVQTAYTITRQGRQRLGQLPQVKKRAPLQIVQNEFSE